MKKTILVTILFAIVMCLMVFLPNSVMAADITDVVIDASEIIPIGGEAPKLLTIDENEGFVIKQQSWEDSLGNPITTFVTGETYKYKLSLEPKEGNRFNVTGESVITNIIFESSSMSFSENLIEVEMTIKVPRIFTITIQASEGVDATPTGSIKVYEGYTQEIEIEPKDGYELTDITIDGQTTLYGDSTVNGTFTRYMNNILEIWPVERDMNVVITAEKIIEHFITVKAEEPKVGTTLNEFKVSLEDTDKYTLGKVNFIVYESTESEEFDLMESDDKFEAGKYYLLYLILNPTTSEEAKYLTATVNGKDAEVVYTNDGLGVIYEFGLLKAQENNAEVVKPNDGQVDNTGTDNVVTDSADNNEESKNTSNNPKTGDSIIFYIILFTISLIGIMFTTKLKYKNK